VNAHAVLGVAPGASPDEIRAAWRRVARDTHPDHGGDAAAFRAAAAAYARLGETEEPPQPARVVVVVAHLSIGGLARRWLSRRLARAPRRVA
jgi:DnaJ domain